MYVSINSVLASNNYILLISIDLYLEDKEEIAVWCTLGNFQHIERILTCDDGSWTGSATCDTGKDLYCHV